MGCIVYSISVKSPLNPILINIYIIYIEYHFNYGL